MLEGAADLDVYFDEAYLAEGALYAPVGGGSLRLSVIRDDAIEGVELGGPGIASSGSGFLVRGDAKGIAAPAEGDRITTLIDGRVYQVNGPAQRDRTIAIWRVPTFKV